MSVKLNNISSDGNLVIDSETDFYQQSTFQLAPHCNVDPSTAEDLTNKSYVDSRLVNSGSGTNMYFNQSVADAIVPYKQLGISIVIATQTTIQTAQAGTQFISSFITDLGYPGTTSIPSGIYELNQFGKTVGGTGGILRYYFTLSKINLAGTVSLIGTSGYSADINTSVTDIFFAQLPLGAITLLSTDRLVIEIYSLGTGTGGGNLLDSQYQGGTFSYITTPIVSGSNFLSLNNVFTGNNSFTNALFAPSKVYPSATTDVATTFFVSNNFVNLADTQTVAGNKYFLNGLATDKMESSTSTSTLLIADNSINGRIDIGAHQDVSGGTGVINIGRSGISGGTGIVNINGTVGTTTIGLVKISGNQVNGNSNNTNIYLGESTSTGSIILGNNQLTGRVDIGTGSARQGTGTSGSINIGTGINTIGTPAINIGSTTKSVTIRGTGTSSIDISSGTITAGTINSTSFAGSTATLTTPLAYPMSNTYVPTTGYLTSYYVPNTTDTIIAGVKSFTTGLNTSESLLSSENSSKIPPTSWVVTNFLTSALAASTYLTSALAASTYLTSALATSTYLTIATAASTYLTSTTAASTYVPSAGITTIIGSKTFTNGLISTTTFGYNYTVLPTLTSTHIGYSLLLPNSISATLSATPYAVVPTTTLGVGVWLITGTFKVSSTITTNANILVSIDRKIGAAAVLTVGLATMVISPSTQTQHFPCISTIFIVDSAVATTITINALATLTVSTATYSYTATTYCLRATRIG